MSDAGRAIPSRLRIENFAQLAEIDLRFDDLTVLVGPQGSGKTLALEWLKAVSTVVSSPSGSRTRATCSRIPRP